jgi:hypothetical protein
MNSYLNFNPTPTPYSYKKSRYKKPKPIPKPAPPPRFDATTLAVGEEGGFIPRQAVFRFDATTLAVGEEGGGGYYREPQFITQSGGFGEGGGGYNPPRPERPLPPPIYTTQAMGEEGGGGYYREPQFITQSGGFGEGGGGYNPPSRGPQFVTQSGGFGEGGGGYNPPRHTDPFPRYEEPPTPSSIDLSVAQNMHQRADSLDGKIDNKADTNQLRQVKKDLEGRLKTASDGTLNILTKQEFQELVESTKKEIEAVDFMINNGATLAGESVAFGLWDQNGNPLPRVIKFDALEETANGVSEDPKKVLLTEEDISYRMRFIAQ